MSAGLDEVCGVLGRVVIALGSKQPVSEASGGDFWSNTGLTIQQTYCPVGKFNDCVDANDFCSRCVWAASVVVGSGAFIYGRLGQLSVAKMKANMGVIQVPSSQIIQQLDAISDGLMASIDVYGSRKASYNMCTAFLLYLFQLRISSASGEDEKRVEADALLKALRSVQDVLDLFETYEDDPVGLTAALRKRSDIHSFGEGGDNVPDHFPSFKKWIDAKLPEENDSSGTPESSSDLSCGIFCASAMKLPFSFLKADDSLCDTTLVWMCEKVHYSFPRMPRTESCMFCSGLPIAKDAMGSSVDRGMNIPLLFVFCAGYLVYKSCDVLYEVCTVWMPHNWNRKLKWGLKTVIVAPLRVAGIRIDIEEEP
jgi:hypothetical protein